MLERTGDGGVARLTMAAPERLNTLSDDMIAALSEAFDSLGDDRSVKVVVLTRSGKAFCAGHDLKELQAARNAADGGAAYFDDLFGRCAAMMMQIRKLPRPVIAEVGGIATAAGWQLVASCGLATPVRLAGLRATRPSARSSAPHRSCRSAGPWAAVHRGRRGRDGRRSARSAPRSGA